MASEAEAEASYVAGFPVPLPLPPALVSYMPLANAAKLLQSCAVRRGQGDPLTRQAL